MDDIGLKERLAHVFWLGGATDSGKSTVARNLAQRLDISVYHFDKADAEQMEKLAGVIPEIRRFLDASLEERWIHPTPQMLFDHLLFVFPHRFPLVVETLLQMTGDKPIIVEGFGLLPELVHPLLSDPHQAVWLIPTATFKWESMKRRNKPSFASSLSDPEKARMNLFARDLMLADYYRQQVSVYGYTLYEVDGSRTPDEMTDLVETHFSKYLAALSR